MTVTTDDRWRPNATVATVIAHQGRFLLVEERDRDTGESVINQPAGHIEPGESLIQAAEREVLEETGWRVIVHAYLGVGRLQAANGLTYLRHTFVAQPVSEIGQHALDEGIIAAHWMTYEELLACRNRHRSPLVMQVVELFIQGAQAPLSLVLDA
jgi:phosphatase NudJ